MYCNVLICYHAFQPRFLWCRLMHPMSADALSAGAVFSLHLAVQRISLAPPHWKMLEALTAARGAGGDSSSTPPWPTPTLGEGQTSNSMEKSVDQSPVPLCYAVCPDHLAQKTNRDKGNRTAQWFPFLLRSLSIMPNSIFVNLSTLRHLTFNVCKCLPRAIFNLHCDCSRRLNLPLLQ